MKTVFETIEEKIEAYRTEYEAKVKDYEDKIAGNMVKIAEDEAIIDSKDIEKVDDIIKAQEEVKRLEMSNAMLKASLEKLQLTGVSSQEESVSTYETLKKELKAKEDETIETARTMVNQLKSLLDHLTAEQLEALRLLNLWYKYCYRFTSPAGSTYTVDPNYFSLTYSSKIEMLKSFTEKGI